MAIALKPTAPQKISGDIWAIGADTFGAPHGHEAIDFTGMERARKQLADPRTLTRRPASQRTTEQHFYIRYRTAARAVILDRDICWKDPPPFKIQPTSKPVHVRH